jgi:hypothetical protein
MAERAQVTSVEAIEAFRARLLVFISKARAVIEEASGEVQRTQAWLEHEQRSYWERECQKRSRALEEAQQDLFGARLSSFRTHTAAQQMAVERAKRALAQAQEKRDRVRRWTREFEDRAEPLAKHVEQFLSFTGTDLCKAVAHLGTVITILQSYSIGPGLIAPTTRLESSTTAENKAESTAPHEPHDESATP